MAAFKSLLNQIFEPLLILTSVPIPLFPPSHSASSPNAFDEIEFPRRGFPLAVGDWRDMIIYLYTARVHDIQDEKHAKMRVMMKSHAEGLRIKEMRRYVLGGHQIIVASVLEERGKNKIPVVRGGVRFLRFERGARVADVGRDEEAVAEAATQDVNTADSAVDALSTPAPTPAHSPDVESPHPSISVYSAKTHSIFGTANRASPSELPVDTVQTTVERDLRGWTLVESIRPQGLYLHHLALLVAEGHDYSVSVDASRQLSDTSSTTGAKCGCSSFAEIVMGAVRDDGPVNDVLVDEVTSDGIPAGNVILTDEVSIAARAREKESQVEAVQEIRARYLKAKMRCDQLIHGNGPEVSQLGVLDSIPIQPPPPTKLSSIQSDVPKAIIEHNDYVEPVV